MKIFFAAAASALLLASAVDALACQRLLATAHQRRGQPVRLLGVGVRLAERRADNQPGLFEEVS